MKAACSVYTLACGFCTVWVELRVRREGSRLGQEGCGQLSSPPLYISAKLWRGLRFQIEPSLPGCSEVIFIKEKDRTF